MEIKQPQDSKGKILIIEDTPMQMRILVNILEKYYDICTAESGTKGLDMALKGGYDLILLDIIMEDMTGYDVLRILKATPQTRAIPVIFITALDANKDEARGLAAGAVDYLTKPFAEEIVRLRVGLHMQLIEQLKKIEQLSLHDTLTEIRNRRSFNLALATIWDDSIANQTSVGMIMLDIDLFKQFNDKYGHANGDIALRTVAEVVKQQVKNQVWRWGGEEFVVLLKDVTLQELEQLAEDLRLAVKDYAIILENGSYTSITVSLGVGVTTPQANERAEDFCNEIDKALYKAKTNGRDRVEVV